MASFESGVSRYVWGVATIRIPFPVDFRGNECICCAQCDLYSRSSGRCPITHEVTQYPDKYVGGNCPLEREEENESDPASASE